MKLDEFMLLIPGDMVQLNWENRKSESQGDVWTFLVLSTPYEKQTYWTTREWCVDVVRLETMVKSHLAYSRKRMSKV